MTNSDQNFITIEEFLQLAVQFEADSAKFYKDLKERVSDEQTRELLKLLAIEEEHHKKTLQEVDLKKDTTSLLQFPPSFSLSMPAIPDETPELDECIEIGLAREQKSVEIYENAATMVSGNFQQLLTGLANFERQHVEKLLSLKRFFQKGG